LPEDLSSQLLKGSYCLVPKVTGQTLGEIERALNAKIAVRAVRRSKHT